MASDFVVGYTGKNGSYTITSMVFSMSGIRYAVSGKAKHDKEKETHYLKTQHFDSEEKAIEACQKFMRTFCGVVHKMNSPND